MSTKLSQKQLEAFDKKWMPEPNSGCWIWIGAKKSFEKSSAYGSFWVNGKLKKAHRVSYEHHREPILDGLQIDHLCRTPSCVNPYHLEPVTAQTNSLRSNGISGNNAKKTHCKRGHEFNEQNTYYRSDRVGRSCRICRSLIRKSRAKKKPDGPQ